MNWKEALNGSESDRDLWKWQRMKDAEEMERISGSAKAAAWQKEARRYAEMLKAK